MVLHSASRLGILSYIYQQRHDIAYTIGMIAEKPIAMCNSDYDFGVGLHIEAHEDTDSNLPPAIFASQEINLFYSHTDVSVNSARTVSEVRKQSAVVMHGFTSPALSIFHPPC
jgi:hypothetical protein